MTIDNNEQALNTMSNLLKSLENRFRAIYNYGFHDGYEQGIKDATNKIIEQILSNKEVEDE